MPASSLASSFAPVSFATALNPSANTYMFSHKLAARSSE
jgi:hypothetical protein